MIAFSLTEAGMFESLIEVETKCARISHYMSIENNIHKITDD
jgi:hypothetical protein